MAETETERRMWVFTFGCGQVNAGRYVKFYGTYGEARQKMFDKFGDKWAFQYSEDEWERLKGVGLGTEIEMEVESDDE